MGFAWNWLSFVVGVALTLAVLYLRGAVRTNAAG
jgi:hypothetical protein